MDVERLGDYLVLHHPGLLAGMPRARLIAGGRSNLTYEIADDTHSFVLRRPPLGHVLETAHDMAREFTVLSALAETDVPVPRPIALCEDASVIGSPFFLMENVSGTPYRYAGELARLGPERTRRICRAMITSLAGLHKVDPEGVGLSGFGRPAGFLERQIRRWRTQIDGSQSRPLHGLEELHTLLCEHLPADSPGALVHGDFRLDNLLISDRDEVNAIIDWEMATIGDPLTDLALLVTYERTARFGDPEIIPDASTAPGYFAEEEILAHYAALTGRDLSAWNFYKGLACFKLAAILEGIHYRHLHDQTVGSGFGAAGPLVEPVLSAGIEAVRGQEMTTVRTSRPARRQARREP
jgi:aminoglycoside phosphotransferase (APT) family kinase protein